MGGVREEGEEGREESRQGGGGGSTRDKVHRVRPLVSAVAALVDLAVPNKATLEAHKGKWVPLVGGAAAPTAGGRNNHSAHTQPLPQFASHTATSIAVCSEVGTVAHSHTLPTQVDASTPPNESDARFFLATGSHLAGWRFPLGIQPHPDGHVMCGLPSRRKPHACITIPLIHVVIQRQLGACLEGHTKHRARTHTGLQTHVTVSNSASRAGHSQECVRTHFHAVSKQLPRVLASSGGWRCPSAVTSSLVSAVLLVATL